MFTYSQIFADKQNILFVTAHPDDTLVYFGALIGRLRREKKNVYVVVVTNGARGSGDRVISEESLAAQRILEEKAALAKLDVLEDHIFCLGYKDGEVESNMSLIGEISKFVRKFKIDLVGTHEPGLQYQHTYDKTGFFVQHRDHRKVGEAVIDAVYPFSRDRSFFPEHASEGIEPHTLFDILLTDEKDCNFDFEYTQDLEQKKAAMREHKSQFDENFITAVVEAVKSDNKYLEKFRYLKLNW
jgi:LmbE family N-acetylglucosaminyl deacetylase